MAQSVLTNATCCISCWEAKQDICYCSCGGINHGVSKRGGEQPARMRHVKDAWYVFVKAMIGQNNTFSEAQRIASRPRDVTRSLDPHYPYIVQSATDNQIDSWDELQQFRGKVYRKYTGPYIIWRRTDTAPAIMAAIQQTPKMTLEAKMEFAYLKDPQEYLPGSKYTEWRPGQGEALEQAFVAFHEDYKRFLAFDAPTGSGKSLSAVALGEEFRKDGPVAILTVTKALQDQYTDDFSGVLQDFRGKSNYGCPLLEFIELDDSMPRPCGDVSKLLPPNDMLDDSRARIEERFGGIIKNKSGKEICPVRSAGQCPYYQAKAESQGDNSMYVTNFANYMGLLNNDRTFRGASTLIIDEAHNLDDAVENYAELTLSTHNINDIGATMPPWYDPDNEEQRVPEWEEWLDILRGYRDQANQKYNEFDSRRRNLSENETKTFRMLENVIRKFSLLLDVKGGYHATWSPYLRPRARVDRFNGQGAWKFRPFYPGQMAKYLLYKESERVVFMSATMERSQILQFGVDDDELEWVETPSTFPAKNSRIYGGPGIQYHKPFTFKNEGNPESIKEWVAHLDTLLARMEAKDHRVLVIVPAGRQVEYIGMYSKYKVQMVLHKNDFMGTKQEAIEAFYAKQGWAILVGAFDIAEGHSFDGPVVEATIFPKLWSPPDFNDPLNILRVKRDHLHNERRKARWFAQAVGRATRSMTDINHTLIMDPGVDFWMKNAKALLPATVKERFQKGT